MSVAALMTVNLSSFLLTLSVLSLSQLLVVQACGHGRLQLCTGLARKTLQPQRTQEEAGSRAAPHPRSPWDGCYQWQTGREDGLDIELVSPFKLEPVEHKAVKRAEFLGKALNSCFKVKIKGMRLIFWRPNCGTTAQLTEAKSLSQHLNTLL